LKIAFTADVHLAGSEHPDRLAALEDILVQASERGAEKVVVAGDLFDASRRVYSDFEALCDQPRFECLEIYVIPGNHDWDITPEDFTPARLRVIAEPQLMQLDDTGLDFLFVPYVQDRAMGEEIAPFANKLSANRWILIGHGDWGEALRSPNPYEPGTYMPLTRLDIETYQPAIAFLGHIHKPFDGQKVHYPGSPYPLNISEVGHRRFLILDTHTLAVESSTVNTDVIYFDERFVVVPVQDEEVYLRDKISERLAGWNITDDDKQKVQVRLRVTGYSSDRSRVARVLEEAFSSFHLYRGEGADLSDLRVSRDVGRESIAERTGVKIGDLDWPARPGEPTYDDILLEALRLIYET